MHLIGHSDGAKLIDVAAKELILEYKQIQNVEERPFIHLTFLDAATLTDLDKKIYGFLANYPQHYSEHYVDRTKPLSCPGVIESAAECIRTAPLFSVACSALFVIIEEVRCAATALFTNELLPNAFNFDITDWQPVTSEDKQDYGHQWPLRWYKQSITSPEFDYGYPLSLEGGNARFGKIVEEYPPGDQCSLTSVQDKCR